MSKTKLKTIVYIDGLNLYYGAVHKSSHKWLDVMALCKNTLGKYYDITNIKYFTAIVKDLADVSASRKHSLYLNSLVAFIPNISIHYGSFIKNTKVYPSAELHNRGVPVKVIKPEEKGSDVNLAVNLINDAWLDNYETAVVISNDSDLEEGIKLVKKHHSNKEVILINPRRAGRTSNNLKRHADKVKRIKEGTLAISQLPDKIPGTNLHKPTAW